MLARSIARRTSSLTSSNGVLTRSFNKSQVSRFAAGGHGDKHGDAHGDGHGHGHDHHPHPVRFSSANRCICEIKLVLMGNVIPNPTR